MSRRATPSMKPTSSIRRPRASRIGPRAGTTLTPQQYDRVIVQPANRLFRALQRRIVQIGEQLVDGIMAEIGHWPPVEQQRMVTKIDQATRLRIIYRQLKWPEPQIKRLVRRALARY